MQEVVIAGIGQTPVGEHWQLSLRNLSALAIREAIADSGGLKPQAMYVGNFLASVASHQANLGALLAGNVGLDGIEAISAEAGEASGAAALCMGYLAVSSGFVNVALVVGVEKVTDVVGQEMETLLAQSSDYDFEAVEGLTPTGQAALLMNSYIHQYNVERDVFADLAIIAHENAINNPKAMYQRAISREAYRKAPVVCEPLNLLDIAPYADGAAAVILTRRELAPTNGSHPMVEVAGIGFNTDALALHDRADLLAFDAVRISTQAALEKAGVGIQQMDFFETWDAFSIYVVLSLEAAGFARRGEGWKLLKNSMLSLEGELPIATMGGLKARGFPLGAAGVYQVVDAVMQLRGQAGKNQIKGAQMALVQALGGSAASSVTYVLKRL
ncbi:MAG TPA: thiolase domain-containing protein [Anaerolineae bacterium]|nr:thiolase domain-containing protein [Anaerolineae bacterium]